MIKLFLSFLEAFHFSFLDRAKLKVKKLVRVNRMAIFRWMMTQKPPARIDEKAPPNKANRGRWRFPTRAAPSINSGDIKRLSIYLSITRNWMRKKGKGHKLMNIPPIPSRSGRRDSNFHSLLCFCAVVLNMKGEKIISWEEEIQFALSLPRHDSQPKAESEETMEMCIVERQTIETNKKLPWLGVQQVPAGDSERKPFKIQAVRSYSGSFAIDSTFFNNRSLVRLPPPHALQ